MNENKWKQVKWNEIIYRFLYAVLLLCIVLFGAGRLFGIEEPGFLHILMGLVTFGVLLTLNFTGFRGRLFCFIGVCAVVVVIVVFVTPVRISEFIGNYSAWMIGSGSWIGEQQPVYEMIQVTFIALVCYVLQVLLERLPMVRYGVAVGLLAGMLVCMFMRQQVSHMGAVFAIWYILLGYVEWTKTHWKKERSRDEKSYMIWIMPFCILYIVILGVLPSVEKPYDWKLVKTAYTSIKESVTTLVENLKNGDAEGFEISFAGFSEDGELKGTVLETNQPFMTLQGSSNLKTNVYLAGKIYDTFDGRSWTDNVDSYPEERTLDMLETLYALERYDGLKTDFRADTKLSIRYRFFQSGYLFAPMKTFRITSDRDFTQGTDITFDKKQGYGTEYELSYWQLNLDQAQFYDYMEQEIPEDEQIWKNVTNHYIPESEHKPTLGDFDIYRDIVYKNYTKVLPLSEKTQDYLDQITKGAESPIEKLRVIERELSSYTYTRSPGAIPQSVNNESEFLDYFLEQKEGYCSYFATAFALLARAEGIPARYVEGFSVSTQGSKEVAVYPKDAHAWPEVYIDGFGWIPFEPTPGYADVRYTPWKISGATGIETSGKPYGYGSESVAEEPEEVLLSEEQDAVDMQKMARLFRIIGITAGAVFAFICLFFVADRAIQRFRYRRMSQEDRFVVEVKKNLWLLAKMKIERTPSETLQELKERSEESIQEIELGFLNDYEDYLYGSHKISQEVLQHAIMQRKELLMQLKSMRKWYYYRIRLFL